MYFSQIRAGLISTALLLSTALASPALAETLPEISPRQIASDVEVIQNPQTGVQEFIAPSFDPFEEDRTCLLYTSPSPRDKRQSRMPSSA